MLVLAQEPDECSLVDEGSDRPAQGPRRITLESALEYIEHGEMIEVTPKHIRLRKVHLTENDRKRAARCAVVRL